MIIKKLKTHLLFLCAIILSSCSSKDDDCMKTITIPQYYVINNQTHSYDTTVEVPCSFPDAGEPQQIQPPSLAGFSYEVLNFVFTPDTGKNTSRLQFEIKLNNPTDVAVKGFPVLTLNVDGLETISSFSNQTSVSCEEIAAKSSCILTFDGESSLDLALTESVKLLDVQYFLITDKVK